MTTATRPCAGLLLLCATFCRAADEKPADVTRLARAHREAQSLGEAEARLAAASSKVERRRLELTARAARLFDRCTTRPRDEISTTRHSCAKPSTC